MIKNITEDKVIKCIGCGQDFTFTAGEQEFFSSKMLLPPRRCKSCRKFNKIEKKFKYIVEDDYE